MAKTLANRMAGSTVLFCRVPSQTAAARYIAAYAQAALQCAKQGEVKVTPT